jgi:hypothetical protein
MTEVAITVQCKISGEIVDFDYDDVNTVGVFIKDLQDQGMAWENESDDCGIFVDGVPHVYHDVSKRSLSDIEVKDGDVIIVSNDVTNA